MGVRRICKNEIVGSAEPPGRTFYPSRDDARSIAHAELVGRVAQSRRKLRVRFDERDVPCAARKRLEAECTGTRKEIQNRCAVNALSKDREERLFHACRCRADTAFGDARQPAAA